MRDTRTSATRTALKQLSDFLSLQKRKKIFVACSGGADSVALVVALNALRKNLGLIVTVVHVDHHLRGAESDADRTFVRKLARRLRLPLLIYRRSIPAGPGNLEERARDARYEALGRSARADKGLVVTGHTQNDQAETLLMNLLRGCGPEGVAGMAPIRADEASGIEIGRPWLGLSHDQLCQFLAEQREDHREDSSNGDPRFLRNYVRLKILKDLEKRAPGFRERLARLAELARDEQSVWDSWLADGLKRSTRPYRGGRLVDGRVLETMPIALQRRLLRRAGGRDLLTFDGVERLRAWVRSPPSNGRVLQLRKGWVVERLSKSGGSPSPSLFWFHGPSVQRRVRKNKVK